MFKSLAKTLAYGQPKNLVSNILIRSVSSNGEVPQFETLAVSVPKPNVFHVELNRPDKLNSFSDTMWTEIEKCFSSLNDNAECRVIVLSARGKHFTAGIDLNSFIGMAQKAQQFDDVARKGRFLQKNIKRYQDSITSLERCVKPILGVAHKACVGAGVDLLSAADMRYCTQDAWFQIKEVDIGLAADVGTLQRFPKIVGNASLARELCFTAKKFDSKLAQDMGFVSRVYEDKDSALKEVLQLAEEIAAKSPVAVQTTKLSLVYSLDKTAQEGLDHIVSILEENKHTYIYARL